MEDLNVDLLITLNNLKGGDAYTPLGIKAISSTLSSADWEKVTKHPNVRVRRLAAAIAPGRINQEKACLALADDLDFQVRYSLCDHPKMFDQVLEKLARDEDFIIRETITDRDELSEELQKILIVDKDARIRILLAGHKGILTKAIQDTLGKDKDSKVRSALAITYKNKAEDLLFDQDIKVRTEIVKQFPELITNEVIKGLDIGWASGSYFGIFSEKAEVGSEWIRDIFLSTTDSFLIWWPEAMDFGSNLYNTRNPSLLKEIRSYEYSQKRSGGENVYHSKEANFYDLEEKVENWENRILLWREADERLWKAFHFNETKGIKQISSGSVELPKAADGFLGIKFFDKGGIAFGAISEQPRTSKKTDFWQFSITKTERLGLNRQKTPLFGNNRTSLEKGKKTSYKCKLLGTVIFRFSIYALWEEKGGETLGWSVEPTVDLPLEKEVLKIQIIGKEMPNRYKELKKMERTYRELVGASITL